MSPAIRRELAWAALISQIDRLPDVPSDGILWTSNFPPSRLFAEVLLSEASSASKASAFLFGRGLTGKAAMSRDADSTALHKLPESVFREVVDRLSRGQQIKTVVRWLMGRPRGELQHEGHYIMRKHVIALRDWMQEDKDDGANNSDIPRITLPKTGIASARQKLEDGADIVDRMTAKTVLAVALVDACESQQQPEARPADRAKARRDICHIGELLGKWEEAELRSRAHGNGGSAAQAGGLGVSAQYQGFGNIDLPDLSPAQQQLQKKAKEMCPTARMRVGDALTSVRRLVRLQLNVAESEAEQDHKQSPPESPETAG